MNWSFPEKPFIGLRPFTQDDNLLFFGRRQQTQELLKRLHDHRFLAVIGSSGSGKSSLVRAGLVPQLMGGFLVSDRDTWRIATMKPGDAPLNRLADALVGVAGEDRPEAKAALADALEAEGLQALIDFLKAPLNAQSANLLVVVDQFEEVFRFNLFTGNTDKVEDVSEFVALLLGLVHQTEIPIYVTLTMRSDFLGDCDFFNGLPEVMNESQYLVPRLSRDQRREAIEGPIKLFQGSIASRLTDRLLNETGEARDDLPLLQHALLRTWDEAQREGTSILDIDQYNAIGTIHEALEIHAEEALDLEDEHGMELTKKVFQTLTELDASNRAIRRPAKIAELVAVSGGTPEEIREIIDRFKAEERLFLVEYLSDDPDNPLIDISHESLIRQWDRLTSWVQEDADAAADYNRIAHRAELHREGKEEYYTGRALELAISWRDRVKPSSAWAIRHEPEIEFGEVLAFLEGSIAAEQKRKEEEEHIRQEEERLEKGKEKLQEEAQQLEQEKKLIAIEKEAERQRNRARKAIMASAVLGFVILSIFTYFLVRQLKISTEKGREADSLATVANFNLLQASHNLAQLFGQKAREAREENRYSETWLYALRGLTENVDAQDAPYLPLSMGALLSPEIQPSREWTNGILQAESAVTEVIYSPDGSNVGLGFVDGRVRIYDLVNRQEILLWPPFHQITNQTIRTAGLTEAQQNCLRTKQGFLFPDLQSNFSTGIANQLTRCGIATDSLRTAVIANAPRFHERYVSKVAYNSAGNLLASAAPGNSLLLWELYLDADGNKQGRLKHLLYLKDRSAKALAFHPEETSVLLAGYDDGYIRFWDLNLDDNSAKPEIFRTVPTGAPSVTSMAYNAKQRVLAVGLNDGRVGLLEEGENELAFIESPHRNVITDLVFSPSGDTLASASRDGTIRLWQVDDRTGIGEPMIGHVGAVSSITYDPRGRILISGSEDFTIRYWDIRKQVEIARIYHETAVSSIAFSPRGDDILFGSELSQLNSLRTTARPFDDESLTIDVREIGVNPFAPSNKNLLNKIFEDSRSRLAYQIDGVDFVPIKSQRVIDDGATTDGAVGVLEQDVVTFSNENNRGFPIFNARETILIEEGSENAAQALFFKQNYRPPFEVTFEYSIYNREAGSWYDFSKLPADGLSLMLLKDKTPYEYRSIPAGNAQAFIPDRTGYGVHFYIYTGEGDPERVAIMRRGQAVATWSPSEGDSLRTVYPAGEWRRVRVEVLADRIRVHFEGEEILEWRQNLDRSYGGLGFGAATGVADAEHKIRNVTVTRAQ